MNQNKILNVAVAFLGLMMALALLMNSLTSGKNMIGELYKFVPVVFAIVGFVAPMQSIYLLFFCGAFMGYLKKVMVLDGYYGFILQYLVVGSPAVLLAAICAGTLVKIAFSPDSTKRDWLTMIGFILLSVVVMAFVYLKSRAFALSIMGGVYANAAWVVEYHFRDRVRIRKLIRFNIAILLISSLLGFYQWIFGLSYLDLEYLKYGYEMSSDVNPNSARPFATYGEAGHFGYAMLFCVTLLVWLLERNRATKRMGFLAQAGYSLLLIVACLGVVCSLKKAPILSLVVFPMAIVCVRYAWASIMAVVSVGGFVVASIFRGDAIRDWCRDISETTSQWHPGLTLNTINTRIESFEQIGDPKSGIKWFGRGSDEVHSHTAITDILIITGYGPAIAILFVSFVGYLVARWQIGKKLGSWKSFEGKQVAILVAFFLSFCAAVLMGTNSYQAFPGSLTIWVVFGFSSLVLREATSRRVNLAEERRQNEEEVPVIGLSTSRS